MVQRVPASQRPNPFTRRTALAGIGAATGLTLGLALFVPSAQAEHLKHREHKAHHRVQQARSALDDSSRWVQKSGQRLHAAQSRLDAARKHLAETTAQAKAAQQHEKQMQTKLVAAQKAVQQAQQSVDRAKYAVRNERDVIGNLAMREVQGYDPQMAGIGAVLGNGDINDINTELGAAGNAMQSRDQALATMRKREAALRTQEQRLSSARASVAKSEAAASQELETRRSLQQEARKQTQQVRGLVASNRKARTSALKAKKASSRQLHIAQRQEQRIKNMILARHDANRYIPNLGGMLYPPVRAPITSPFGWRMNPVGHYWGLHNGDDFGAGCGVPERAAGSGRVVSEYYSDVWGHRLFLDLGRINGHNFTVVYNHISRYVVGPGAHVSRGQVVSHVGTTGWSTGCHLHFTVLRDGTPVNPMKYMG